jgi:hypothetical protein
MRTAIALSIIASCAAIPAFTEEVSFIKRVM